MRKIRIKSIQAFVLVAALSGRVTFAEDKTDIEYGKVGDQSLRLDAHVPDGPGPFPTVLIVHGGGWGRGDKRTDITVFFDRVRVDAFARIHVKRAQQFGFAGAGNIKRGAALIECLDDHGMGKSLDRVVEFDLRQRILQRMELAAQHIAVEHENRRPVLVGQRFDLLIG